MTKNPFYNSIVAFIYIVFVVFFFNWVGNNEELEFSLVLPIIAISLLTLSVAVMAYLFFYQPVMLFLDKKKEEAIKLFLKTVGIFGAITLTVFLGYIVYTSI
jgi:hypothetical protein